ncbi:diguanylate cyclase domain-containing protein [Oscillibacter sp.]|nr:diguanylate cyclase [Oscillibacter sp.]
MNSAAEILQDYLKQVMHDPESATLNVGELPEELREFGNSLVAFCRCLADNARLAKAISKGNLNVKLPPPDNELAAPLKALHAFLRHLTWQTQQVAMGDYRQRVDFMGDFSDAFNTMIEQLDRRRTVLLEQIRTMMQSRSLYEMLAKQIEQQIIVTDADTSDILFVSSGSNDLPVSEDGATELIAWLKRQTTAMRGNSDIYVTELELPADGGKTQNFSVSMHPLRWDQYNAMAFVLADISAEREQMRKLQNIANFDTLTKLNNRRYGMETLENWIAEKRSFALCFIDMDDLKQVNDRYGHEEGDRYIMAMSGAMLNFSPNAVVCRIGGDEFMLLAENWDEESAAQRMEQLRGSLVTADTAYDRSMSYGVISVGPDNTMQAGDLLAAADERMYEYKRAYKLRQRKRKK